ncbi:hypothetical protein T484DRAFT_1801283, partial [Baffinella frigidus]
ETALAKVEAAKVAEEKAEAAQVQAIRDASVAAQKDKNAAPTKKDKNAAPTKKDKNAAPTKVPIRFFQ